MATVTLLISLWALSAGSASALFHRIHDTRVEDRKLRSVGLLRETEKAGLVLAEADVATEEVPWRKDWHASQWRAADQPSVGWKPRKVRLLTLKQESLLRAAEEASRAKATATQEQRAKWCQVLVIVLFVTIFAPCFGPLAPCINFIGFVASVIAIYHVIYTGIWDEFQANGISNYAMSPWCLCLAILVLLWIVECVCVTCCLTAMVSVAVIANTSAKKMNREYVLVKDLLPVTTLEYLEGGEFKNRVDKIFDEADTNKDGKLCIKELKASVFIDMPDDLGAMAEKTRLLNDPLFIDAFDKNGDAKIDRDEFLEMLKYIVVKMYHGDITKIKAESK